MAKNKTKMFYKHLYQNLNNNNLFHLFFENWPLHQNHEIIKSLFVMNYFTKELFSMDNKVHFYIFEILTNAFKIFIRWNVYWIYFQNLY